MHPGTNSIWKNATIRREQWFSLSRVQLLQPQGLEPARRLCPQYFPGKNTEMVCHFFLQGIFPTQGWKARSAFQADSLLTEPPEQPPLPYGGSQNICRWNKHNLTWKLKAMLWNQKGLDLSVISAF